MRVIFTDPNVTRIAADFEKKVAAKGGSEHALENVFIEMSADDVYYLLCHLIEQGEGDLGEAETTS